jgi:hypothetical protein
MNCSEFENIVNDLARAKIMGAASRTEGMAHVEICERCAARLADERALVAGLKSLAAIDEGKSAPPRVEAALLKAFRDRVSNPPAPRLPVMSKTWPRRAPRRVILAAAAILIAFGFIVYRAIKNEPQIDDKALTSATPSPGPSVKPEEQVVKENVKPRAPRARRGNRPQLKKTFIIDSMTTYAKDCEDCADFFPLPYGENQKPMERGEVIRVQMPRSALIAFGLPVNVEGADTPVKADLLVGEDGLARAIRFVR